MNDTMINRIGKYVVWFVVLVAIGYLLGMVFQAALFVLPGVLLLVAVYYVASNMKSEGVMDTLKNIMSEPFGYIKTLFFAIFKRLVNKQ